MNFFVDKTVILKRVIKEVIQKKELYGTQNIGEGKTVLVEYSSPNMAKPFHAGHLRSTLIGNFLVQIHKALGYNVVGINYLGDWGKQYGLLAIAYEKYGNEEALQANAIKHLFDVYVQINKDADGDAEKNIPPDPSIHDKARAYFKRMEDGDKEALAVWQRFRDLSIEVYKKVYDQLGVSFDVYSGESMQSAGMAAEVKKLEEMGLLMSLEDGAKAVDLSQWNLSKSLIRKKDGTTLYITRDISAAVGRWNEYHFDKMFYVVGAAQDYHFKQLFKILELMGYDWVERCQHINFGMVKGMSTRKGTAVFLEQILDEAKDAMMEVMQKNQEKYSEIEDPDEVASIVGASAVFVQDMSARRIKDYAFEWSRMTSFEGHTGPYLQFAHARIASMERKADTALNFDADLSLVTEPEALELAKVVGRYPEALEQSAKSLEAVPMVMYLFDLSHAISLAHQALWVKGQAKELAEARLLVYWAARITLENGMKIIGLKPLDRM